MDNKPAASLALRAFGGVELRHQGQPVHLRGRKAVALLLYLAIEHGRRHSRESLLGLLWPEMSDADARNNLRVVVAQLRRKLKTADGASPYLASNRHQLWFEDDGRAGVDFWAFQDLLARCDSHAHTQRRTCSACQPRLAEAVSLYRGEFLAGFHLDGCPAFDEWLYVWRERLHVQVISLLTELVQAKEAQGELDAAVQYARRQIELDPLQEPAYRDLMRLFTRQNQRAQALTQFEALRRILQAELGVEPDAETLALWQEIKRGDHAERLATSTAAGALNLPQPTTPFIGREKERQQISRRLADGGYRLLSIVGPGGSGKTRLAIEAARENLSRFADGVYFVPLDAVTRPDAIPDAIATAVGLSLAEQQTSLADQIMSALAPKQMLLLIDNLEHVMAGADFLLALLQRAPRLTLLVTSRERLNAQSEDLFRLRGLPYPDENDLAEAGRYAAVRLFCDRAYRLRKGFKLTSENTLHVVRICRIVGGMPLGIELAATWVRDFSTADLAQALAEKVDMLATTMRDIAPQHRSMEIVFNASWRLLTTAEQTLFARLSVFCAGFSRTAATAVAEATPMTLLRLRYQSLIYAIGSGRYALHDLLRQFAARALAAEAGGAEAIHGRHAAYYLAFVAEQAAALHGETPQMALQAIEQDLDNVRQAWHWAVTNGRLPLLQQSFTGLARFYAQSGRYSEGEMAMAAAVELCEAMTTTEDSRLSAWRQLHVHLLTELIDFLNMQSKLDQLLVAAAETVERATQLRDLGSEARALLLLALAHVNRGDNETALPLLERGLRQAQVGNVPEIEGVLLRHIGNVWRQRGNLSQEGAYLRRALAVQQMQGYRAEEQTLLIWLAVNRYRLGDFSAGRAYLEQARALNAVVGDPSRTSKVAYVQGLIEAMVGAYTAARDRFQAVYQASVSLEDWWQQAYALVYLGAVNCKLGQHEVGVAQVKTAVEIAGAHSLREVAGDALTILGHVYVMMAAWPEARIAYQQALAHYREIGNPAALAEVQIGLAYAAWQLEGAEPAVELLVPALPLLDGRYLGTAKEPIWMYLAAARILQAAREKTAASVRQHAVALLNGQADALTDARWRQLFLENVGVNRAVLADWGTARVPDSFSVCSKGFLEQMDETVR